MIYVKLKLRRMNDMDRTAQGRGLKLKATPVLFRGGDSVKTLRAEHRRRDDTARWTNCGA